MKNSSWRFAPLALIVVFAFIFRLYRIHYPLLDWHSWRQADTASVTREYVKHGVDLLRPTYHDLSNIPNYLDNSEHGYRMVEFPIINALVAVVLSLMPFLPLVQTSRIISILFSLGTLVCLYFLTERLSGKRVAVMTAISFATLPYIVYYSRVILPDVPMVFFSTLSILGFVKWLDSKSTKWYLTSLVSLMLAFLLKPFVAFLAPVYLVLSFQKFGKKVFKQPLLYIFPVLAALPFAAWREWIAQFPEGIPASDWLYNGNQIRFKPAWARWLGFERVSKLMLGIIGVIFLPVSLLDKGKDSQVYFAWWLGVLLFFIVIATGNVQHDYYQILLMPILAISVGKGSVLLRKFSENILNKYTKISSFYTHWVSIISVSIVYLTMILISWTQVHGYFNVNIWEYQEAGRAVDRLVPDDAKVIAPAMGDTSFLFQTNRTGWPIGSDISQKIKQGATHYVTINDDSEARKLSEEYFIIEKTDNFTLIDLTRKKDEQQS